MVFNDTSQKLGLIQHCEDLCGFNDGDISGNTVRLQKFTAKINRAEERFVFLAMTADGKWQYDDSTYTTYAIATTNLVSGQRDYPLAVTHLAIEKVLIYPSATSTSYSLILPIDQNDQNAGSYLENTSGNTGTPNQYDLRANSLFLDPTPSYNSTNGIKIYFLRGPNSFVYTATSTSPGFASTFHDFLSLFASREYAIEKNLSLAKSLDELVGRKEQAIIEFFSRRDRDSIPRMISEPIIYE